MSSSLGVWVCVCACHNVFVLSVVFLVVSASHARAFVNMPYSLCACARSAHLCIMCTRACACACVNMFVCVHMIIYLAVCVCVHYVRCAAELAYRGGPPPMHTTNFLCVMAVCARPHAVA